MASKRIALIGPHADAKTVMQGNYHGIAPFLIDPITGFNTVTQGIVKYFEFDKILFLAV
jgi:hypothetical protein